MKKTMIKYSMWFIVPALLLYLTFFLVPNVMTFGFAFTDWTTRFMDDIRFIGLDNFRQMAELPNFAVALKNTLYFTVFTSLIKNVLGIFLAVVITNKFRTAGYLKTVFFAPCILSPLVVGLIFSAIYNPQTGILNQFLKGIGLGFLAQEWLTNTEYAMTSICWVNIWQWTGFCMVIYIAAIANIPEEYFEAAKVDGASRFQSIFHILLPNISYAVITSVLFSITGGLKVFGEVYSLTNGGPMDQTQVIGTYIYKYFGEGILGYSSAVSLVFTVIVCVISYTFLGITKKWEERSE